MAKDMEVERSAKENEASTTMAKNDTAESKPENTPAPTKDPYMGKYNWDTKDKTNKKADNFFPLHSGVISDYAWADGKKAVSIYVTLKGLDSVSDEDLILSLSKDRQGLSFKVKNLEGKMRFFTIEKLNKKVKKTKLIRKKGRDQVVLKLFKEDEDKKWYMLKSASGGSSYGDFGEWSDDETSLDPLEECDDVPTKLDTEDKKEENAKDDVPMENAEEKKEE